MKIMFEFHHANLFVSVRKEQDELHVVFWKKEDPTKFFNDKLDKKSLQIIMEWNPQFGWHLHNRLARYFLFTTGKSSVWNELSK